MLSQFEIRLQTQRFICPSLCCTLEKDSEIRKNGIYVLWRGNSKMYGRLVDVVEQLLMWISVENFAAYGIYEPTDEEVGDLLDSIGVWDAITV